MHHLSETRPALSPTAPLKTRHFERSPDGSQIEALIADLMHGPCVRQPREVDRPLVLYGGGNLGRMARAWCERVGIPISMLIDSRANDLQADPFWRGVKVRAPEAVAASEQRDSLLAICVATSPNAPIEAGLLAQGWRDVVPFYDVAEAYRRLHPLSNGWFAGPLSEADRQGITGTMLRWQDDLSRAHHLQFVAWRCLREEWSFGDAPVNEADRFFIEPVRRVLTRSERFVDAGAHHGEVIQRFIRQVDGRFETCAAIEPDSANRSAMLRAFSALPSAQRDRIGVLPLALAEHSGRQRFAAGLGYASQCCASGADEITVHRLDALDQRPTFLKLHLEGHEWPVLRGAIDTLRRERPILALTVYHNRDGLFATADWLMRMLGGYRFWFRIHSWCGTGAVVYGIPEERF